MKAVCPQCRRSMARSFRHNEIYQTRDHILPFDRGGSDKYHGLARNIRPMCNECNNLTAAAGHCIAALACARSVARSTAKSAVIDVLREWGFPLLVAKMKMQFENSENLRRLKALHDRAEQARRKAEADRREMKIANLTAQQWEKDRRAAEAARLPKACVIAKTIEQALDEIDINEFVYPQDTPEKVAWNLAVLARHGYALEATA